MEPQWRQLLVPWDLLSRKMQNNGMGMKRHVRIFTSISIWGRNYEEIITTGELLLCSNGGTGIFHLNCPSLPERVLELWRNVVMSRFDRTWFVFNFKCSYILIIVMDFFVGNSQSMFPSCQATVFFMTNHLNRKLKCYNKPSSTRHFILHNCPKMDVFRTILCKDFCAWKSQDSRFLHTRTSQSAISNHAPVKGT